MSSQTAFLWAAMLGAIAVAIVIGQLVQGYVFSYMPQHIMTANEVDFFDRLLRANPNGFVFPQVAMSALIVPRARHVKAHLSAFRRIAQKRVDFAVYTNRLEMICVVELDDSTHNARRDAERDAYLASAGIVTVRWSSSNKPSQLEIRACFEKLRPPDAFFSYGK